MPTSTKVVQKCKACGGDLIFNPSKGGLVCKRCGNFQLVTGTMTNEKSFLELLHNAPTWQKDTAVLRCENCGAKTVVSKYDLVARCEYCGTANVVKVKETPGLRPDTIVLFGLSHDEARKQVVTWLSKRLFLPSQFKKQLKERQLNGVYYPVFTFDANVLAKYTGTLVQTNTMTVKFGDEETTRTQTIRRAVADISVQVFDDCLVLANEEITPEVLRKIQNFDTNHGQAFQQSYLAGFTVCQATKEPQECWEEAKKIMEHSIREKIYARYRGENTTLENLRVELDFTSITYKYTLLPIYVGQVDYKNKKYPLYLNGQTGKVYGKTPKSWWKILLSFGVLGAAFFGLGIFLAMFL